MAWATASTMGPDDALLQGALQPKPTQPIPPPSMAPGSGLHPCIHLSPGSSQEGSSMGHIQPHPHPHPRAGPVKGTDAPVSTVSPKTPANRQQEHPPRPFYQFHLQSAASIYDCQMRRSHSGSSHASSTQGSQQSHGIEHGWGAHQGHWDHQGMGSSNAEPGLMPDQQAHNGNDSLVAGASGAHNGRNGHRHGQRRGNAAGLAHAPTGRPSQASNGRPAQGRAAVPQGRGASNSSSRSSSGASSRGRAQHSSYPSGPDFPPGFNVPRPDTAAPAASAAAFHLHTSSAAARSTAASSSATHRPAADPTDRQVAEQPLSTARSYAHATVSHRAAPPSRSGGPSQRGLKQQGPSDIERQLAASDAMAKSGASEGAAFGQLQDHQKPLVGHVRHMNERGDDTHVALSRLARSYGWQQYVDVKGKQSEAQLASVRECIGVHGHALHSFSDPVYLLYSKVSSIMQTKCSIANDAENICFQACVHKLRCHQVACSYEMDCQGCIENWAIKWASISSETFPLEIIGQYLLLQALCLVQHLNPCRG